MAAHVRLKRESGREFHFAYSPLVGVIFLAVGVVVAYMGWTRVDGGERWFVSGVGALFAVVGLVAAFWRYELTIDFRSRTYERRRGFWPVPQHRAGSLDELVGVVLTQKWVRTRSSSGSRREHAVWEVSLEFDSWDRTVTILSSRDETTARDRLEFFAEKFRAPVLDRSGSEEVRTEWRDLDTSFADRLQAAGVEPDAGEPLGPPPPQSGIEWHPRNGEEEIVLPAVGLSCATVFLVLFGLAFLGFGAFALSAVIAGTTDVSGPRWVVWLMGGVFVVIGGGIALGAVLGSKAREVVRRERGGLSVSLQVLGRSYRTRDFPRAAIEEIRLRHSTASRRRSPRLRVGGVSVGSERDDSDTDQELVIRSDERVAILGRDLDPAARQWLYRAVRVMAVG